MLFRSAPPASMLLLAAIALASGGCVHRPPELAQSAPPAVVVAYPIERSVTDFIELTGQLAPVDTVEVRPRVWGYLDKVHFKEGMLVKAGDLLYEIDPRTYQAALDEAVAKVALDEANVKQSEADHERILEASK